jgi:hypothetical protein
MSGIRCIIYNNVKDQIERTLAHYQRQNKYCRRSLEFLSVKKADYILFGLKRTPITIYSESGAISKT